MKISIVIPTLNEAPRIGSIIHDLRLQDSECEIIIVDGGSQDGTLEQAEGAGARTYPAPRGRGQQLALGAAQSTGNVILFLHADTQLPAGGLRAIRQCLKDPEIVGGNFRVLFNGNSDFAEWLTGFYARFRRYGLYYGDSAIFVRRCIYDTLGGIRPIDLMEDYDFTRRLERVGKTVCIDTPAVETSSRRFDGRRPIAIVAGWLLIHALFHLKLPPRLLARLYDSTRRKHRPASSVAERVHRQSDHV
ncbi:TIGR04283 family arsenosugar biosynthesis glycosyltransferase [Denitrobaculum tricleocarpae]|uniref:Glycosyltransferase n=1 Tax=Denitrobaculum tricleocarpae TaxID=2591009 RepID=A0A545TB27_9PROT|nr:TIGR04283 family arsenosugar biosynthesis glycosyltransferase [Denitrobaculum tricleocarpae]TQV74420.1 glycosyltransferase [Denitrobaculum tricleocarpae]